MTNNEMLLIIKELKKEGISHKLLAEKCDISVSRLYQCIYKGRFTEEEKNKIILFLENEKPTLYKTIIYRIKIR